jgi:hypothetical protein
VLRQNDDSNDHDSLRPLILLLDIPSLLHVPLTLHNFCFWVPPPPPSGQPQSRPPHQLLPLLSSSLIFSTSFFTFSLSRSHALPLQHDGPDRRPQKVLLGLLRKVPSQPKPRKWVVERKKSPRKSATDSFKISCFEIQLDSPVIHR